MDTLRQQISESVFALDAEERKVKWFDKRNRKLQDEMAALKEHMKSCTVTRTEMGQYKKKVDEQVRINWDCRLRYSPISKIRIWSFISVNTVRYLHVVVDE